MYKIFKDIILISLKLLKIAHFLINVITFTFLPAHVLGKNVLIETGLQLYLSIRKSICR